MSASHLIGIDIGTTSVKAVMIDLSGRRVAEFSSRYPTSRPAPGLVEQDPEDWLRLVQCALAHFAQHGTAAALCLTSQVNTHVFADARLAVLHPAIVWQDGRAGDAGASLDRGVSTEEKIALLGAPIPIDASHALARMAWMQAACPDVWDRTAHVLLPRDWVLARLTGVVVTDPISSVGLVTPAFTYAAPLIARLDGAAARLAPLADPLAVVGRIGVDWPLAGTPVVLGMMDAWASLIGLGVAQEGEAFYLSGTSDVLGIVSDELFPQSGIITFPEWRGLRLHAAPTQSGGASLDWAARLLGRPAMEVAEMAQSLTEDAPLFLPHLQGERAPIWDAASRGGFAGLNASHGAPEMAAAVLEGVAFSARHALEVLERSAGVRPAILRAGGGGFASDAWAQLRADVMGRPIGRVEGRDPGAIGAAVMAGVGVGARADLATAAGALVRADRTFTPRPAARARADSRYLLWRQLYEALRPVNHALSGRR
ncbi:MAG: carbohydrate kinase [Rhodobacteraceae bacterium]|nr:carbohydrate kinase [Paracoccaceae bacterium]